MYLTKTEKFLFSQVEEGEALATGNLPNGGKASDRRIPISGLGGARDSYDIYAPRGENTITDEVKAETVRSLLSSVKNWSLFGMVISVTLILQGTSHQTEKIDLIKDTNKIRFVFKVIPIVISGLLGDNWNVNMNDYEYEIISESNGHLAYDNSLLEDDVLSFRPYYMEQKSSSAAAVRLNTMRLMEDRPTRFVVTEKSTGKKVFNINLTDFLALTSMEEIIWMYRISGSPR